MTFAFILAAWVFSLCLHEFAHAGVAYLGGDTTVKDKGYLTLNPLKFTDPVLSFVMPVMFLLIGGLGLPGGCVYIERRLLRSPAWDCAVSLAGPAANLVLALLLAAPFYLGFVDPESTSPVWQAYAFLIVLQFSAVIFNLIPIPPLDGFQAMAAWFNEDLRDRLLSMSSYGFFLLFMIFWYVDPINNAFWDAIYNAAAFLGVPPQMAFAGLEAFLPLSAAHEALTWLRRARRIDYRDRRVGRLGRVVMRAKMFGMMALLVCTWAGADGATVIAHRGASGYLPEHTLEAYAMAYAMGADYIEPDLVLTKDKVFICMHDIHLELTTDVEQKFPDRKHQDGHWYPADFTLAEIKTLAAHERLKTRFPQDAPGFQVPTFEEMIRLIQGLNKTTGRDVGIYPEMKEPAWHEKAGLPMEKAVLDMLAKYGYTSADSKVYLQSFELDALKKVRELGAKIPTIFLIAGKTDLSDAGMEAIAKYASGIGPDKSLIEKDPALVERAHAHGLKVHPYTFRVDDYNKAKYGSYDEEVKQFVNVYKIDGFFTDQADRGVAVVHGTK